MLNLIIADASLETLPTKLYGHHSLKKIRHSGMKPHDILLDRSLHHFAMMSLGLENSQKRGRPDIIHVSLVNALATPLYQSSLVRVFIHTVENNVILVGDNVRIPKSYCRFEGLIINLFQDKKIVSEDGKVLLELQNNITFRKLLEKTIKPDVVVGLSTAGTLRTPSEIAKELITYNNPCLVIGGFPKDHFSYSIDSCFDKKYSIHTTGLETQVVVSRLVYEYEKNI